MSTRTDYILASCRTVDPELFYPTAVEGTRAYDLALTEARQICGTCPLLRQCLAMALGTGDDWAILAGTSPGQRRLLSRELRAA